MLSKPFVWLTGVVATALATTLAALLSTQAGHLLANRGGDPVRVDSVAVVRAPGFQGGTYVFPQTVHLSPAELSSLNQQRDAGYDDWFRARGAVDPDETYAKVVLEGNRDHVVRVTDVQVTEKRCSAPLTGTMFYAPPAGADEVIRIGFDLDQSVVVAQKYVGLQLEKNEYFSNSTISLKPGEQQVLQVMGKTSAQYCQFMLQLTVVDGTRTVTEPISNHGRPFQVTAVPIGSDQPSFASYKALYVGGVAARVCCGFAAENPQTYTEG
jgi:hypothetical protein